MLLLKRKGKNDPGKQDFVDYSKGKYEKVMSTHLDNYNSDILVFSSLWEE